MKTLSVEKFKGLQVQANSFSDGNGNFEIADNVVISRDDIVSKRRGYRSAYYLPENGSTIVDYKLSNFAIGNHIYRLNTSASGTAYTATGTSAIVVRASGHGLNDSDWITDFESTSDDVASAFPLRYSDFVGQVQITTEFTQAASASGTLVTVTQTSHGLQTGDRVSVVTSAVGATGTFAVTRINADSYRYTDATSSGTGNVTLDFVDAFQVIASENATAAASGQASWDDYTMLGGDLFHVSDYVPTLKTGKNLYWVADEGLHCIEEVDGDVRKAGVPPALDTDAVLSGTSGGVSANSQVAYRIVFGRKDANNTIHLSAPSDTVVLANTTREVLSGDLSLATGTHVLTVTDSGNGLTNGDTIYLYNVVSNASPSDGSSVVVTGVSGISFTFDFDNLGVAPSGVTSLEYGTRKTATIYASIPSEITSTEYFYQVYRSDSADATVIPDARYKEVEKVTLTAADLSAKFVSYVDELPYEIIQSNAELYTNPTQEGESQANNRPPLAEDLALFKGYSFFGNCTAYRQLALSLVNTSNLANGDKVTIAGDSYVFRGNATNSAIGNDITSSSATGAAGTVTVTQNSHGLLAGDTIYAMNFATPGTFTVATAATNTFTFASAATGTGTITYEARSASGGEGIVTLTEPSSTAAETIAEGIDFTARSLVKAINRKAGSDVYAQYVSGVDESPGRILLTSKALDAATFAATASTSTVGGCFTPSLPTTGTTVSDFQDVASNALFCSKYLETEAVPIINRFPIGSQDSSVLRVVALRDSLIVFKQDGVFRLNGDSLQNFTATALDTTVILKAQRSVAVLNNSVYALTNQGVVQVTDTSVRIISRQIEPLLIAIIGNANLDAYTSGVAIESERLYILSTIDVNTTPSAANVCYVFNYLTNAWTTYSGQALAHSGFVNASDKYFHILAGDRKDILAERHDVTKIDYTGQHGTVQCYIKKIATASAISGTTTVCVSAPGHSILVGDVVSISGTDSTLASAFASGASSVDGLRAVVSVTDKVFCFAAGENSTASVVGSIFWQRGISELDITLDVTSGEKKILFTTSIPHGLQSGDAILIDSLSATVSAAYPDLTDILGYRPVTIISTTEFQVKLMVAAGASATGTANIRDQRGILTEITIDTAARPQTGDALVSDGKMFKIVDVEKLEGLYIATTNIPVRFTSKSLVFLHEGYVSRIKFAPITMGTGVLKQFSEFQAWFRNSNACSQIKVNFSTDSRYSDTKTTWSTFVGTPAGLVTFGGWGSQKWGGFPWGGGSGVELDYETGPAVPLRTWIPQSSYLATFIQPEMVHETAGEPLELQSVTLIGKQATQKVSK